MLRKYPPRHSRVCIRGDSSQADGEDEPSQGPNSRVSWAPRVKLLNLSGPSCFICKSSEKAVELPKSPHTVPAPSVLCLWAARTPTRAASPPCWSSHVRDGWPCRMSRGCGVCRPQTREGVEPRFLNPIAEGRLCPRLIPAVTWVSERLLSGARSSPPASARAQGLPLQAGVGVKTQARRQPLKRISKIQW